MVNCYVASPGEFKYGYSLKHRYSCRGDEYLILWEGHDVPYWCSAISGYRVPVGAVPVDALDRINKVLPTIDLDSIAKSEAALRSIANRTFSKK